MSRVSFIQHIIRYILNILSPNNTIRDGYEDELKQYNTPPKSSNRYGKVVPINSKNDSFFHRKKNKTR